MTIVRRICIRRTILFIAARSHNAATQTISHHDAAAIMSAEKQITIASRDTIAVLQRGNCRPPAENLRQHDLLIFAG